VFLPSILDKGQVLAIEDVFHMLRCSMEKFSSPLAGGLGGAALLALILSPWASQNHNVPDPALPSTPNANSAIPVTKGAASVTTSSLSMNEQGPWYALCKSFSTIDPEDTENTPNHPTRPQAGLKTHPPLFPDGENILEEIKEETITKGEIQRKFAPVYHYKADLGSCLPAGVTTSRKLELSYIVATVPDPLGSHMALQFDRNIVAIERAAEANNFVFERYWFPWSGIVKIEQNAGVDGVSNSLKQQLRQQPGILIFRKKDVADHAKENAADSSYYSPRLLVFLVGETPTSGINKIAFSKAAGYIDQLKRHFIDDSKGPDPAAVVGVTLPSPCAVPLRLSVLGPNFSASFSPLYRALYDLRKDEPSLCIYADIRSPTTTVDTLRTGFALELQGEKLGVFTPIAPLDSNSEQRMLTYVRSLGYTDGEIAYLSEDETVYSPGTEKGSDGKERTIATLRYPRDLSALRNTWEPASINITPADIAGNVVKTQTVPFSLREQASNELDSPSAFAADQAAPDIDQALTNLITIIRHNRYRVIIVTASNPLDEVYLLQYIRHNAPDLRLATYDQDSLMLRAAKYESLRGTISVTSFPLVSTLHFNETDLTDFPNSSAEATYIGASLFLVSPNSTGSPVTTGSPLLAYLEGAPGTYLLGEDGFWPVQVSKPPLPLSDKLPLVPWFWYVLTAGTPILVILHLWKHRKIYLPRTAVKGKSISELLTHRGGLAGSQHTEDLVEDYFLLFGNNQLITILFLMAVPSAIVWPEFVGIENGHVASLLHHGLIDILMAALRAALLCLELFALFLLSVGSALLLIRIINTISKVSKASDRKTESTSTCEAFPEKAVITREDLIVVVVYPVATMSILSCVLLADRANLLQTAFRWIYVLDGLSPLPVALSVFLGWYLIAIMGLRTARNMKVLRVDPILATLKDSAPCPDWAFAIQKAQRDLLHQVEAFAKLDARGYSILLMGFFVLLIVQGWPALRGVDNELFRAWLFMFGLGLLSLTILIKFSRVWSIWTRLRALLNILYASPLGPGFERIPENVTSVKLWRSFERQQSHDLQKYTLGLLRRISCGEEEPIRLTLAPYIEAAGVQVGNLFYKLPWSEDGYVIDHQLLNTCLDAPFSISAGGKENWFQQRCEQGDALVIEFAALRYVAIIKYVNAQVRALLAIVLYGYVLLILGFKTYPFQGQHTIGSVLTIVFTIIFVYAAVMFVQVDSNPLLSIMERTPLGKANYFEAAQRLLSVGGIPLIAVLASQFPAIERFLLSWVKPTIDSLH
jgi:hypothetical protein